MSVHDNEIEDEARNEDSETDSTTFLNVLAVTEEDADQVVVEDDLEQTNNVDVDGDDQQLSQDDMENFLENDCIVASQSCSQGCANTMCRAWAWISIHPTQHSHTTTTMLPSVVLLCAKHQTTVGTLP